MPEELINQFNIKNIKMYGEEVIVVEGDQYGQEEVVVEQEEVVEVVEEGFVEEVVEEVVVEDDVIVDE